ncbi:hypothetical protein V1478_016147 [Vespula squamosa]|uniref:Uncharacterized protein n=1 Tax=Vespula squamosa TaxID=30214 RepID=A0ABD2A1E9_VESSQ
MGVPEALYGLVGIHVLHLPKRCLSAEAQETSTFGINTGSTKTLLCPPNLKFEARRDIFCYYRNDIDRASSVIEQEINK